MFQASFMQSFEGQDSPSRKFHQPLVEFLFAPEYVTSTAMTVDLTTARCNLRFLKQKLQRSMHAFISSSQKALATTGAVTRFRHEISKHEHCRSFVATLHPFPHDVYVNFMSKHCFKVFIVCQKDKIHSVSSASGLQTVPKQRDIFCWDGVRELFAAPVTCHR